MSTKRKASIAWGPAEDKIVLSNTPMAAMKLLNSDPEFKANKRTVTSISSRKYALKQQGKAAENVDTSKKSEPTKSNLTSITFKGTRIDYDPAIITSISITTQGIKFG